MIKIWLPFNENLKNNGLDSNTIAINGSVSYADAIFGKGLSCNGSSYLTVSPFTLGTKATIAWWAKTNDNSAMFWVINAKVYAHLNFWLYNGKYYLNVGDSLNNPFQNNGTDVTGYADNAWHHLAVVFDGSVCSLYVDGAYYGKAKTYKSPETNGATNIRIAGGFANAHDYDTLGTMCDFRVYDHVLEPWEIKDLSNQKVFEMFGGLHLEETTNLITGITKGGQTNVVNNEVLTTGTNADTYFTLNLSESIVVGTQYTISCYADLPSDTYWDFPIGTQSNTGLTWRITPGYNSYTFTANDISWGANRIFMDDLTGPARTSGQQCRFYRFQLEKKSHATPLSFGHRDSRIADLTDFNQNSITPYSLVKSGSTFYFDGVNGAIQIPGHELISAGTWTVNLWFLKPNGMWSSKGYETLFGGPSGFELEAKSAATNVNKIVLWNWGKGNCDYEFDKWNMVTMTRTSSGVKLYLNGELKTTGSAGSMPTGNYFIDAWNTATQQNFNGYIRSLSVYKKALTQEDITNLYTHGR